MKILKSALVTAAAIAIAGCSTHEPKVYKAEWSDLAQHQTPQWLLDAKFGIYCHWGPQTYVRTKPRGEIALIDGFEGWTGEKFDAEEWARLFEKWGAQFAGPLAQHCSGCLNWDSEISDWNTMNRGPKRDILGELAPAIKSRGMKFMASFHTVSYAGIWGQISKRDREYQEPIMEWDSLNRVDTRWMEGWSDRVGEATEKYGIDLVWFDTSLGRTIGGDLKGFIKDGKYTPDGTLKTRIGGLGEEYQQKTIANYYNLAERENREVEVVYKSYDIPRNVGMRDVENGNLDGGQYDPWMTDVSILLIPKNRWDDIWFYGENNEVMSANSVVDMLVDVVSKNGRMLLNVPPKVDGTFAERVTAEMDKIGRWLDVNGEAIYATNPWCIYGEGETYIKHPGHHGRSKAFGRENPIYNSNDLRYTTKGRDIYAFVLDKPESGEVHFKALGAYNKLYPGEVKKVSLLGHNKTIEWSHEDDALVVKLPQGITQSEAYCFKVER